MNLRVPVLCIAGATMLLLLQASGIKNASAPPVMQHAYVTKVYSKEGRTFISADYVQMLTGKAALAAAQKAGEADTTYNDAGTVITDISVPNDYYIVNDNKKLRELPLANNVKFEAENIKPAAQAVLKKRFMTDYRERLFSLTLLGDSVTKVREIYLP